MENISVRTIYSIPCNLNRGKHTIKFICDDILYAKGKYKLILGLSSHEQSIFSLSESLYIEVLESVDKNQFTRTDPKYGMIINKGNVIIN